ncbi:MAG: Rrf2 family transcriptional regulator [Phyllobacteriaceae bacterium]|nr:Rrf2 family transcriptional regulator [Phyllobacteriaceae bacterium]
MRLTSYTNYALRTLMFAALDAPALVRVQDVAEAHGISRTHLVKCVHHLGQWGYLENVRGRGGGFRLARPAEAITVGEIVRRTEEGFAETPVDPAATAADRRLDASFETAQAAFLAVLDRRTIRDITFNDDELRAALGLSGPAA